MHSKSKEHAITVITNPLFKLSTAEELLLLEDPYSVLKTSDGLEQHKDLLNGLDQFDKKTLAERMALGCPPSEIREFCMIIANFIEVQESSSSSDYDYGNDSSTSEDAEDGFFEVLGGALLVRETTMDLLNSNNSQPHLVFLEEKTAGNLFNEFNNFALELLKDNELFAAERLACLTPESKCGQIVRVIQHVFPETVFATHVSIAFELRYEITNFLLGDKPELFFKGQEFSIEYYLQFSQLVNAFLKDEEQAIGKKLATIDSAEVFSQMHNVLIGLNSIASFRLIADVLHSEQTQHPIVKNPPKPISIGIHPNGFLSQQEIRKRKVYNPDEVYVDIGSEDFQLHIDSEEEGLCGAECTLI